MPGSVLRGGWIPGLMVTATRLASVRSRHAGCRCTSSGPSIAACGLREQLRLGRAGLPGWYVPKVCKAAGVLLAHHSVHEPVDDLCKKAASLWVWGEMLGIAAASRARGRAVTWEKPFTPCA
jgi:hypothetical protein